MKAGKFINGWTVTGILLAAIVIAGGVIIWSKSSRSQSIEISLAPEPELQGSIYVGGGVSDPGIYPLRAGDTVQDIVRAAGGFTKDADPGRLELIVSGVGEGKTPQKVNINRAEAWLLEALPGIGEARARAIIEYRERHGPFRDINELVRVEGLGEAALEKIRDLITVAD
jgi:competence protein ComEA